MIEKTQRTVVITGASTGIGEACAILLDQMGFLVFAGVRKDVDAQKLQQKASSRLTPIFLDITDADSISSAVEIVTNATAAENL